MVSKTDKRQLKENLREKYLASENLLLNHSFVIVFLKEKWTNSFAMNNIESRKEKITKKNETNTKQLIAINTAAPEQRKHNWKKPTNTSDKQKVCHHFG